MKKLREIRAHLAATVPSLQENPEKLFVYVEKGSIACRAGNLNHQYRYEAKITVLNYTDPIDTLLIPLLAWIAANQPELLQNADQSANVIRYDAEIIDHERADIDLSIDGITERVLVTEAEGIYTATHCAEPALPDLGGTTPWTLYVKGVEVAP